MLVHRGAVEIREEAVAVVVELGLVRIPAAAAVELVQLGIEHQQTKFQADQV
jgi:hypothetical protein